MNNLYKMSYLCASLLIAGCNTTSPSVTPKMQSQIQKKPVLVMFGGDIITVSQHGTFDFKKEDNQAVLIVEGVIKQVATKKEIQTTVDKLYADTQTFAVGYLDLNGRTLMPGFIEPHAHLEITAQAGMVKNLMPCLPTKYQQKLDIDYGWFYYPKNEQGEFSKCYLYLDEAIASVASEKTDESNWLVGNGLDPSRMVQKKYASLGFNERLNKNKEFLNFPMSYLKNKQGELVTDNPMFLFDQSGHLAYANMKAFEKSGFCNAKVDKLQLAKLPDDLQTKIHKSYDVTDEGIELTCYGPKDKMEVNQQVLSNLCFEDGSVGIAKTNQVDKDNQMVWQYSGLIKESSAYMMFVNAMMSSNGAKQNNIRSMIKHGASDSSEPSCPLSSSSSKVQANDGDNTKLMNTMKYILNTSSQQGVTTFVEGGTTPEMKVNYTTLVDNGDAYTRIRSLYDWREFNEETTRISLDNEQYQGMFSAEGIKLLSDGSTQGCSANLLNIYSKDGLCEEFGKGHRDYSKKQIQKNLQRFANCGWYFNIHANGDQSIKDSVGALLKMNKHISDSSKNDIACKDLTKQGDFSQLHHTIIHSTVSHQNGVHSVEGIPLPHLSTIKTYLNARETLPNLSPSHLIAHVAYWGASMKNELGTTRGDNIDPMGDEKRAGIPFSLHSDLSISPLFPLWFIEQAVTRNTWEYPNLDFPSQSLNTSQAVSIRDAIKAVTLVPAQQHNIADKLGSIEEGKLADLIVLDKNPLDFNTDNEGYQPTDIHSINVQCTFIGGKQVPWYDLEKLHNKQEQFKQPNCNLSEKP